MTTSGGGGWTAKQTRVSLSPIRRLRHPSEEFWFGTDMLGRDVYSRVIYGSRISLTVGIAVAALSIAVGLAIGLITGFIRERVRA